jgi:hypothetical protein
VEKIMADNAMTDPADGSNPVPVQKPGASAPGTSAIPGDFQKEQSDIAKILEEVKLPERRAFKTLGDVPSPRQIEISPILSDTPLPAGTATQTESSPAPSASPVVAMHTLRDDLQHVVREQKISVVRAMALEEEKRGAQHEDVAQAPREKSRMRGVLFATGLLSLLGLAALGGIYLVAASQAAPLPQQPSDSLVFAEQSDALPLDNTSPAILKDELAQARNASSASLGSITRIVPVISGTTTNGSIAQPQPATFSQFMSAIGAQPPADLLRSLSDTFFLGLHTVDKNAPVIVINVTSYDHAFAGMLAWEPTMNADLSPLFTPLPALVTAPDGIPTQRTFTDVVMNNYDVRALKDDSGQVELYYSFPTRNILIIAESPYTFTEILTRLQALKHL